MKRIKEAIVDSATYRNLISNGWKPISSAVKNNNLVALLEKDFEEE